jgi:glycosyltransferase involved in cell wall biosynthesis
MIRERQLQERFILAGMTTRLDRYLSCADVVVLPSFTEGLPNVALEASAAGVAVVATAVGGTPEVIADGQTGFLVPPGDPATLADKINSLLMNATMRTQFGVAGRERMRQQFTFEAQAGQYWKLFDQYCMPQRLAA